MPLPKNHVPADQRGVPPFRYVCVGDSDGETVGYDHTVYDATGEDLCTLPNERVGLLFAASHDLLTALETMAAIWHAYVGEQNWDGHAAKAHQQAVAAIKKATGRV